MSTPQAKIGHIRSVLNASLIERPLEIDGAMTAMLSGQNFLMVGSPGTAKSLLCDGLLAAFDGELNPFSYLFMKTSTPEDVFGPLDVPALVEERRHVRLVDGYLPSAHVAFLDEIWKAGPAILNSLLKILNEKKFRNGTGWLDCPLLFAMAASNEYPSDESGGKELGALFDRFVIRLNVKKIGGEPSLRRLLWGADVTFDYKEKLTLADLASARAACQKVSWNDDVQNCLLEILRTLKSEGVDPGDRRKRLAIKCVQAFAYLNGRNAVSTEDMEILASILWDDPVEQPAVCHRVIAKIANPTGFRLTALMQQVNEIAFEFEKDSRDLTKLATAVAKLNEVEDELATLRDPRARRLLTFCKEQQAIIRKRSIGVVDSKRRGE